MLHLKNEGPTLRRRKATQRRGKRPAQTVKERAQRRSSGSTGAAEVVAVAVAVAVAIGFTGAVVAVVAVAAVAVVVGITGAAEVVAAAVAAVAEEDAGRGVGSAA